MNFSSFAAEIQEQEESVQTEFPSNQPTPSAIEKAAESIKNSTQSFSKELSSTKLRRESSKYVLLANYSPIDLIILSKYGISLGWSPSVSKTWELEYLRGTVSIPFLVKDLGQMSDERISLMARSYSSRNSFNISYGLTYFDFSMHLGDQLLNRVSGGTYPSMDLVRLQSLGFNLGIGNRWVFQHNITLGVDWLAWSQPVVMLSKKSVFLDHATNSQDRDDVSNAMDVISYFPRLTLLKIQFGMVF